MTDGSGLILNPQDYIHAYATQTPAMSGQGALYGRPGSRGAASREHDPNSFAKELRDKGGRGTGLVRVIRCLQA